MNNAIKCTFVGHATTVCRVGGTTILTDPHFGKRVAWATRREPCAFDPASLDGLAAVLISHMHYDHMHIDSYKYIASSMPVIVPERTEPIVGRLIPNPIIELSHWATHELVDGTRITAVPLHHRGGRLSQLRYTGTNGYIVETGNATLLFCGDSAYGEHFREIGNLYAIDLALLPIGCYAPRWFMKTRHMTPAEAVSAFEDLKARTMLPIHWGSFRLSFEQLDAPREWLERIIEERPDLGSRILITQPGETRTIEVNATKGPVVKAESVHRKTQHDAAHDIPASSMTH